MAEVSKNKNKMSQYKVIKTTCEETKIVLKGAITGNYQPAHKVNEYIDGLVLLGPFSPIHHGVQIRV